MEWRGEPSPSLKRPSRARKSAATKRSISATDRSLAVDRQIARLRRIAAREIVEEFRGLIADLVPFALRPADALRAHAGLARIADAPADRPRAPNADRRLGTRAARSGRGGRA